AAALGLVEGFIGPAHEPKRVCPRNELRDTEARCDPDRSAFADELERSELRPDPLGCVDRPFECGSRQDDQELLATPATAHVDVSERPLEHARELPGTRSPNGCPCMSFAALNSS